MSYLPRFSLENVAKLGILPNGYVEGNRCADGAVVVTDYLSLKNDSRTEFSIRVGNHVYTGDFIFRIDFPSRNNSSKAPQAKRLIVPVSSISNATIP